ncbi:FMRFamide peptide receptor frpr-18-like [Ruditapes philippinarum]|uniref:FMRFamide peptide receptor frpr-18-like n=1 Tax=Ruditapes philippinarum TaxID=129788 RepID=UPI00295C2FB2|nr:FMRFamide peptide receptor frpr-18-like [Ruditapes philippinarum]
MDFITTNGTLINDSDYSDYITDYPIPVIPKWGFWAKFLSTPVIVLVGIIGNVLSFLVMKTKTLRRKTYSHYLCALAVLDTFTLIFRQVESVDEYFVSYRKTKGIFQNFDDGSCKLYNFLAHVITLMCSWLVVFMAVERVVAVRYPFKRVYFRRETGAGVAICILFVVVCLTQSFRLFMIEHIVYDEQNNIHDCLASDMYIEIYTSLDVYFFLWALVFVLPVVLITVCNITVICHIIRVRKDLRMKDDYLTYKVDRARWRRNRSTVMLLIVTFLYIITLLPLFTLSLIVDVTIKVGSIETARNTYVALRPFIDLSVSISLLNYAVNFFVYILSGKRFRYELRKLFIKKRFIKRRFTVKSTREEILK